MPKRALESPTTVRGKRIKPVPEISTAAVARPVWRTGQPEVVTWSSQGDVPAVNICLHLAPSGVTGRCAFVKVLACHAKNSGSHEVLVPGGLTPGQYIVRVESSVNGSVIADSAECTVVPTGALPAISAVSVAHPVWLSGQQEVITWDSQGEVPTVDICLHRASAGAWARRALAKILVCKASNCGSYELLVPGGLTPGQYVVRVESSVNRAVVADSAEFTVECTGSAPAISQAAVRQLIWHGGSRQQVTWGSQGEVPAVDICLHRAPANARGHYALAKVLILNTNNSGSHDVLVPVGLTPGQYIVRIDSSVNSSVIADSAEFTVDDEHRERCVRYALLLLGLPSAYKLPYALIRKVAVAAATD